MDTLICKFKEVVKQQTRFLEAKRKNGDLVSFSKVVRLVHLLGLGGWKHEKLTQEK